LGHIQGGDPGAKNEGVLTGAKQTKDDKQNPRVSLETSVSKHGSQEQKKMGTGKWAILADSAGILG